MSLDAILLTATNDVNGWRMNGVRVTVEVLHTEMYITYTSQSTGREESLGMDLSKRALLGKIDEDTLPRDFPAVVEVLYLQVLRAAGGASTSVYEQKWGARYTSVREALQALHEGFKAKGRDAYSPHFRFDPYRDLEGFTEGVLDEHDTCYVHTTALEIDVGRDTKPDEQTVERVLTLKIVDRDTISVNVAYYHRKRHVLTLTAERPNEAAPVQKLLDDYMGKEEDYLVPIFLKGMLPKTAPKAS